MRLRKASLTAKLIVLSLVIFAVVTIASLQPKIVALSQRQAQLSQDVTDLQQENLKLEDDIQSLGSDEAVVDIAHHQLNLVFDNEEVFIDSSK